MGALRRARGVVLVVEDDPPLRTTLRSALEDAGYHAILTSDGHAALNVLNHVLPSVILLDLMMPGMNGWQFIAEAAAHRTLRTIPIVVLTAARRLDDLPAGIEVLPKPMRLETLLSTIERVAA